MRLRCFSLSMKTEWRLNRRGRGIPKLGAPVRVLTANQSAQLCSVIMNKITLLHAERWVSGGHTFTGIGELRVIAAIHGLRRLRPVSHSTEFAARREAS